MKYPLLLVGLRQVLSVSRAYRGRRSAGAEGWQAFEEGLGAVLPLAVARFVALEPKLWHCFYRWVTRRPLPPQSYSYHRRSPLGPLLLVVAFSTPAEILVVEIIVPWGWVRIVFLVAALYACFWVVAYYASLATLPHRLLPSAFEMRYGPTSGARLSYASIAAVQQE